MSGIARVALLLLVLTLVYGFVAMVKSRADYGTLEFWGLPERINYCGRRYYPSSHDVKLTHKQAEDGYSVPAEWKTVGRTFTLRRIEAATIERPRDDSVCTMQLFISTGDGTYRSYGLSGGP